MEFTLLGRDRLYIIDREEDELQLEFSKSGVVASSSATSPSSSSAASGWHDVGRGGAVEKEHMFDKVVTPSDVGKLNRLVIPKHHAEKHFPLDTSANEKGMLLSFEDRTGKPWRFRYSYWNSSQSYVMTKGWSRFVKEKGLSAGDTVSFGRGVGEAAHHRFYIDWKRRRPENREPARFNIAIPGPWSGRIFVPPPPAARGYSWPGRGFCADAGGGEQLLYCKLPAARPPQVQQVSSHGFSTVRNSVPQLVQTQAAATAAAKRVRLFGVNLDCPESSVGDAGLPARTATAFPLLQPLAAGSSSSSSTSKEQQHSPLDLYL
ncbi:hypothetical protein Cni_G07665 [Canna indica]|uniref:TF-B3 domain-containing protein n=1 Tax=Canna indica TaxID=4628 RepID=A0AAQ3K0P5_9LILI|nr:hypothetical protein Cni_G07665 [Canna indica]